MHTEKTRCDRLAATIALIVAASMLSACAFDLVHVKQVPISFAAVSENPGTFVLRQDVNVGIGTGYQTRLRAGTRWRQVGRTPHGDVFTTKDQILTVEASNIHEARLVVNEQAITGFYLPVEKTFVPVKQPIPIDVQNPKTDQEVTK